MSLSFQNPSDPDAPYLLEHVLNACQGATRGGGAFAWATATGVELLLEDPTFSNFLTGGPFDLVIGVDAITNARALAKLCSVVHSNPSLTVQVLLHNRPRALFHPKMCWFAGPEGGTVIAGSGNLTVAGLRGNWEAFATLRLPVAEVGALEAQWAAWKTQNESLFRSPADPLVLMEASKNTNWKSRKRTLDGAAAGPDEAEPEEAALAEADPVFPADAAVLIAEIPKSDNRWNQANFDIRTFTTYFGARRGTQRRVLLRHVDAAGHLGRLESRPGVIVASHNYRFELAAAAGLAYPSTGRPIAVFIRQPSGILAYRLLLPSDHHYSKMVAILAHEWVGAPRLMRRIITNAETLRLYWPDAPFWSLSESEE